MPQKKKLNEFGEEIEPLYEPPEYIGDNVPPELNTLRKAKKKVAYGALTGSERASMGY
jgi:hypothetical protein